MKSIIKLFLTTVLLITILTSCTDTEKIEYLSESDIIKYNETEYHSFDNTNGFFSWDINTLDEISSIWYRPLIAKTYFYSDSVNSPNFICSSRASNIWFKKDFSFANQEFTIENTNISYKFSNSFLTGENFILEPEHKISTFKWHLSEHKSIYNTPTVYKKDNIYYIQFAWDEPCYKMNHDFLNLLLDNDVITK